MSSNDLPDKCKKRFKGVENFLRRIAFNLGNTPSQTEVKIISCIPIDVTDLQQKILCLEKQLDAVKNPNQNPGGLQKNPVVQTALCRSNCSKHSNPCKPTETYPATQVERCEGCSMTNFPEDSPVAYPPKPVNCTCWSSDATYPGDRGTGCNFEYRKGLFKKQKKKKEKSKKKDKGKTQLVYYAQTSNSPFRKYSDEAQADNKKTEAKGDSLELSHNYISEMIRKQYTPVPIIHDYSLISEFSTPVCRDVEQNFTSPSHRDSDVCSCCYGPFHDIDNHLPNRNYGNYCNDLPTCPVNTGFYDTSLYDLIPVKEKSTKTTKPYYENPKRKLPNKTNVASLYYPESNRSRTKVHPYVINNYGRTSASVNYHTRRAPVRIYTKKEKISKISSKRDKKVANPTETSDSGCIDCGNVYMKRAVASNKPVTVKPTIAKTHKNAECLTMILNDTECQTTTTQSVQIDQELLEEKKTEETLHQIKTILQSVLTEVKTNTQLKKVSEDKSTKDAVVQKGSSQGNMPGGSSLMNSFTYSPYNMNPFLATCSRQMSSGPCCYPNMPYNATKCIHNFPVFIQTPGRAMCSCYRNSSYVPKINQMKQANTAATNTDIERSKETEKLIKEIYKSMTVNMNFPNKDASASEYNDLKSTPRISLNKSLYRPSVLDENMRKFVKANALRNSQKSATPRSSLDSKLMSNTLSMRSQIVSTTDTERRLRNRRLENYLQTMDSQKRQNKIKEERHYEQESPETTASDEEESSDADVNAAYVPNEEPAKKIDPALKAEPNKVGLFRKMLKTVKLFTSKNKKKEEQIQVEDEEEDEESEDNSDDYQTVYSQRVERNPRYVPYPVRSVRSPHKIKAHSKISFSRHMRDRNQERSRKPYMEQEYRRHWNERFHENQNRYSSEERYRNTPSRPAYWQNYEARSALMERRPTNRIDYVPPQIKNHTKIIMDESPDPAVNKPPKINTATKGLAWLKKHKLGIHCGPQWKKFILEG